MITLTEEQAKQRLENSPAIHFNRGVGNHTGSRTPGIRKTDAEKELMANIALDNKLNGITIKKTAEEFGIHPTTLGDYTHGALNNSSVPNDEKSRRKPEVREDLISEKALDRLTSALDNLTPEKLEKVKANDLASVAVKMATVHEKISGKNGDSGAVSIVVYAPKMMQERHFDVIEVTGG